MDTIARDTTTSILHLPDDCLYFIFQRLESVFDRKSFGLTCHRWLFIENTSRRSLQFPCSFRHLHRTSLSRTSSTVGSFQLYTMLDRFQHLELLCLSGCVHLPDSGLSQLQYYGSKLQTLYLDCCFGITDDLGSMTDDGLSVVASGCRSLKCISLYRCNVSSIGIEALAKSCRALEEVNLSYCPLITDTGIRALSQNCHQLRAVRISSCRNITGVGFHGCPRTFVYLEADSCKLETEGITEIVSGGGLEYLNISNLNWAVPGNGLTIVGAGFAKRLKLLDFRLCRTVTDESIIAISRGCPLLQEWNLALCHEVKRPGWESIGLSCHKLERLHVKRCRCLCDRGLQALREGCRNLLILYVTRCRQLSDPAIMIFKCLRGDVKIIEEEVMCIAPEWAFSG
ncbi:F-box/LRR-repeat protein 12 [Daucus carota subsp. sativus]|uniref:F-box/LRR-repeat protein 12 n=1 Tax=Daucus carota subsp. sativus TaxID=79200 RepID=UPI0007EFC0F6|nr:PREDICTED: F-box/LRR-repeat protein 12 [Daucus carota subsp. sativus]